MDRKILENNVLAWDLEKRTIFNTLYSVFSSQEYIRHTITQKLPIEQWDAIAFNAAYTVSDIYDNIVIPSQEVEKNFIKTMKASGR